MGALTEGSAPPRGPALPARPRRLRRRLRAAEEDRGKDDDNAAGGGAAGRRRLGPTSMSPRLLLALLAWVVAAAHAAAAFQMPWRGWAARLGLRPRVYSGRPLYSVEEQGPRTRTAAEGDKGKLGGDGGSSTASSSGGSDTMVGAFSRPSAMEGLLARRLSWVAEVDDVDRAALYLARRALETRVDTVDLVPFVVLPPGDEAWMEDRLAAVRQCMDEGGPTLLSVGELVVPVRYKDRTVAALLVEDARRGRRKRRPKAAGARAASAAEATASEAAAEAEASSIQSSSSAAPAEPEPEQEEAGGAWGAFSEARVSRIQEVVNRVLGAALKDTLITDESWQRVPPPSRRDVVGVDGGASEPLPFSKVKLRRQLQIEKEQEEAAAAAAAARAAARGEMEDRPVALGVAVEELLGEQDPSAPIVIPKEQVTTSVGGATNVTFDLHMVEDFKHLFDGVSLGSLENNTNLAILKIAAPVVAALALEPLISLVDTYYVGHYLGPVSLSAYGLSERVYVFSLYVLNFLATSTTPIVANLRAQGEEEAARELVGRLLFFGGILGIVLIPILQTLSYPLLNLLGARPENYVEAVEYFQVRSWGTPAIMIMAVSNGALRGYLETTYPLIVAAIAFVVDYSVDPKIVYPQDPDGLGAAGAATVVAEYLSAGMFLSKFMFGMKPPIFPVVDLFPPWAEMAPVVKAGFQIFVRTVLLQALLAASCATAARIGPIDIAAHQVALQLWIPPSFLMDAFSIAAQGLVADALGRGDRERARELSQLLIKWGVAMGGLISLAFAGAELWAPESLPRFFTEDQGIMDKVENVLWVIAVMQPINGLVNVGAGVLQGAQDFTYQVITMGLSAIFAGSLFFLLRDEGLLAVWETLLAFQVVRSVLFAYRFNEPLGPLAILPKRRKQQVLVGSAFSTDVFDHDKNLPRSKRKKRRPWL